MDSRPLPPALATGVAKEGQGFHRNRNPFTLKVVADSGLARTKGEMRTMPAKWLGLSAAVRMAMAPPCKAKRAELLCAGARQHTIPSELHGRGPLSLVRVPRGVHLGTDAINCWISWVCNYFITYFFPQEQTFQRDTNKVPACGLQVKQYIPTRPQTKSWQRSN